MSRLDVGGYLTRLGLPSDPARLGLTGPAGPSVAALFELHRAHVERVPYENLEIQLGVPTTVDPYESAERIVRRGRGGYCFHLNGAFSTLLSALGYQVRWHVGGAQCSPDEPAPGASGDHLALTVHGLVSPESPDGVWFVDAGLGDALYEPLPLLPGVFSQGPFTYTLERSSVVPCGWCLKHDPSGSFIRMDFAPAAAGPDDFRAKHNELSTSPDSPFVRTAVVQRRDSTGVDNLRGRMLSRVEAIAAGTSASERLAGPSDTLAGPAGVVREEELTSATAWYSALADVFGLTLDDVPRQGRQALWDRVCRAHDAWVAARTGVPA